MRLIVGLGNPGEKYANNRHNVGFMFVQYLADFLKSDPAVFKKDKYSDSEVFLLEYNGDKVIIAKPQTYMNKSGAAVSKLMKNYETVIGDLIVVHDDLDIPLGKLHIQVGVGPQLHNGLKSVDATLKTKNYTRVRVGVDARTKENWINGESYALTDFFENEKKTLYEQVFPKIRDLLKYSH